MVRVLEQKMLTTAIVDNHTESVDYFIFVGNSSDTKPTTKYNDSLIANGSKFITVGDSTYLYDEENTQWVKDNNSQGGGIDSNSIASAQEVVDYVNSLI